MANKAGSNIIQVKTTKRSNVVTSAEKPVDDDDIETENKEVEEEPTTC